MVMAYVIKGVILDERDIKEIHEYYKNHSMAEYLNAVFGVEETLAFECAPLILELVENEVCSELEAIQKVLKEKEQEKENDLS